jgi:Fic family protein
LKAKEKAEKDAAKAAAKATKDAEKAAKKAEADKVKAEKDAAAAAKKAETEKAKLDKEAQKAAKIAEKEAAKQAKLAAKGPTKKSVVRDLLVSAGGTTVAQIVEKLGVADTAARSLINDVRAWGYIVTATPNAETKVVTYTAVKAVADPSAVPPAPPAA